MFSLMFWIVIAMIVLKLNAAEFDRTTRFLINAVFYLPKEVYENIRHIFDNFKRDYGQRAENK